MLIAALMSFIISLIIAYISGNFLWGFAVPPIGFVLFGFLAGVYSGAPEFGLAMGLYMASLIGLASGVGALFGIVFSNKPQNKRKNGDRP